MEETRWLFKVIRFLSPYLARAEFLDTDYVPKQGGIIITSNHLGRLDVPLMALIPGRLDVFALAADKYRNHPIYGWFMKQTGCIFIDRSRADFTAFRAALDAIKEGRALGIAPEGTRSRTGQLIEAKSGAVLLAMKSGAPIVPTAISGTEGNAMGRMFLLQRPRVTVRFGAPYYLPTLERGADREVALQRATDEMMCRIAALLPERYRGFYANHARLKEILAGDAPERPQF